MSIAEDRYRENSGQRFLQNGRVRCHALSKSRIYRYREEHDDWDTPSDELWPECQCSKPAEDGAFVCRFHGIGDRPKNPLKSVLDVIPIDMREKVELLLGDPVYLSRREDIAVLRARQWELLENLQQKSDGEETWGVVSQALYELQHNNVALSADLLKQALETVGENNNLWKEYYSVQRLLDDTTTTEVKTAKELQSMATAEQVGRLINRIYEILMSGAEKYIEDKREQANFLRFISRELNRAVNLGPATVVGLLESGSGEEDGDSE